MEQHQANSHMHHDQYEPGLNGHDTNLSSRQAPTSLLASVLGSVGLESQLADGDPAALQPKALHHHTLPSLLRDLVSTDWVVRVAAIDALGTLGDQAPLASLLSALHDEDETVRATTLRVLAQRGYSFEPEQITVLLHDPAWHVREIASFVFPSHEIHEQASLSSQPAENPYRSTPGLVHVCQQVQAALSSIYGSMQNRFLPQQQRGDEHLQTADSDAGNMVAMSPDDTKPSSVNQVEHGKRRPILHTLEGSLAVLIILAITLSWLVVTHHFQLSSSHIGSTSRTSSILHANLSPVYSDSSQQRR